MKLKACNLKSHSIITTTPLPSLCGEMGFYLDISGNQDVTVKLKSRLIFLQILKIKYNLIKMSSDFNFTFASCFPENVQIKPHFRTRWLPPPFLQGTL